MFKVSPPCAPDVPALDALASVVLVVGVLAQILALAAFALGRSELPRPSWINWVTIGGAVVGVGLVALAWLLHAPWC